MKCPKCGGEIPFYDLKPNCSHCGVNIMFANYEPQFQKDRRLAEMSGAHARVTIEKLKKALAHVNVWKFTLNPDFKPAQDAHPEKADKEDDRLSGSIFVAVGGKSCI